MVVQPGVASKSQAEANEAAREVGFFLGQAIVFGLPVVIVVIVVGAILLGRHSKRRHQQREEAARAQAAAYAAAQAAAWQAEAAAWQAEQAERERAARQAEQAQRERAAWQAEQQRAAAHEHARREQERLQREEEAKRRWEAQRAQRRAALTARFGAVNADRIMRGEFWAGQTRHELIEALGSPEDIDTKMLKTKKKEVFKYKRTGANRFALRITLDDDVVVGWEDKR